MDQPKTYFIFRPMVYKPDDLIRLGQLITDPRKPFQRLAPPLPLKGALKPRSAPATEWRSTNSRTGEVSVGVFAHAVSMLKAEASVESANEETETWEAAILETRFFEISEDAQYVEQTANNKVIDKWLKQWRHQGKTLYMITGLKIAKKPGKVTFDSSKQASIGGELQANVDSYGLVDIGGHGHAKTASNTAETSTPQVEYIFGYRLRKLKVMWRKLELRDDLEGGDLYNTTSEPAAPRANVVRHHSVSDFEIEGVSLDQSDFGKSLPERDRKLDTFDEEDNSPCLAIPVGPSW